MCELLFFFYRQSLLLHHFQFPLGYLPSRCVIKLLVCGVRAHKAPRHVLLVLSHVSDCRGRIHRSSVFGRRRFFREIIVLLIVGCIDKIVLKYRRVTPSAHASTSLALNLAAPFGTLCLCRNSCWHRNNALLIGKHCAFRVSSGSMPENTAWTDSPRFSGGYSKILDDASACSTTAVTPCKPFCECDLSHSLFGFTVKMTRVRTTRRTGNSNRCP